ATRSLAILRLCLRLLITLILLVTPFLAAAAITYLVLLTRYDINYYLAVRPPEFWLAATFIGFIITGLVWVVAVKIIHWLFALPLLLFERTSPRTAINSSKKLTQGRRLKVAAWLVAWVVTLIAMSMLVTSLIGVVGRFVIPSTSESLVWVALAVGVVVLLSGIANLVLSFLGAALLGLLVVRLYVSLGGSGEVTAPSVSASESSRPRKMRSLRQVIIGGSSAVIVATVITAIATVRSIPTEDTTQITAHRGSSIAAPENTLAAVERSIADGADWVEIDVQEIADGTVVVFHDGDLRRVAGLSLRTRDAAYEDLNQIDVGSWHSPRYADQRIPTLEQVLELCKDRIGVNIELKYYGTGGNLEQRVIDIVEHYDMESQVVLMSLKRSGILKAKALRPDWKMGLLTAVALGDLTRIHIDFLAVSTSLATRSFVWSAHRAGREVQVWTVNDPVQMWALITRGVDNLITDVPAMARTVLDERAGMSLVERLLVEFGAWSGLVPYTEEPIDEGDA
ncbi:MAG: glycerophosphoryl diester phosphodiesterase membrane domain-containing protein, partial [Gemmatimonadota bacterium]